MAFNDGYTAQYPNTNPYQSATGLRQSVPYMYNQQPNGSYGVQPQAPQVQMGIDVMNWVDGEAAAKAFQVPPNWPANKPIPLWDINEPVIYFRSVNIHGMPNPLGKARYITEDEQPQQMLMSGQQSGAALNTDHYVTKDDFDALKNDILNSITSAMTSVQASPRQNNGKNGGKE